MSATAWSVDLTDPARVMSRLADIEHDLDVRQGALESAARKWFLAKRDRERAKAVAFLAAEGTVAVRQAVSDRETAVEGVSEEAEFEALRAVVRVLETRASICQSLLKAQGRV